MNSNDERFEMYWRCVVCCVDTSTIVARDRKSAEPRFRRCDPCWELPNEPGQNRLACMPIPTGEWFHGPRG